MLFKQQGSTFRSGTLASNGDAVNAATDHHDLEPLAIQGRAGFLRDVHTILDAIPRLRLEKRIFPDFKSALKPDREESSHRVALRLTIYCPYVHRSFRLMSMSNNTGERFERAVSIMARLRAPGGCPWDREQTFDSIKPYTLEETYEVLEAIDNRDWEELTGESGDLLLQVLFYAQMAKEQGTFSIVEVLDRLSNKLVDRHPHVFGEVKAETSSDVLRNREALRAVEKKRRLEAGGGKAAQNAENPQSVLAGGSTAIPALLEAYKLSSRAAHVGFDWPNVDGLFEKLHEETDELREQLKEFPEPGPRPHARGVAGSGRPQIPEELRDRLEDEVGDLFFVLVNIARYLSLDPESALRKTNRKFKQRFQWMEEQLRASRRGPQQASMEELESLWQQAKQQEREK